MESGEDSSKSSAWRGDVLRLLLIMLAAAGVLVLFINYPTFHVVVVGVLFIASLAYLSERKSGYDRVIMSNRAVLVTGCDTGFGHALAVRLSEIGVQTFAGCLYEDGEGATKLKDLRNKYLHVIQLDVTKDEDVLQAVEKVSTLKGKNALWAVVNNAGLNFLGDAELTLMSQYEMCVQINQLGAIRVTKQFLPLIRKCRGRIVNVTSVKGEFSEPFNAAYASTKFAMEGFSDSLRREMKPFGVDVSIIQPCNFGGATDALNVSRIHNDLSQMWEHATDEVKETYGKDYLDQHNEIIKNAIPTACQKISLVTDAIIHALFAASPKARYLIGGGSGWMDLYWIRARLVHYLPTSWFDAWLRRDLKGLKKPLAVQNATFFDE